MTRDDKLVSDIQPLGGPPASEESHELRQTDGGESAAEFWAGIHRHLVQGGGQPVSSCALFIHRSLHRRHEAGINIGGGAIG